MRQCSLSRTVCDRTRYALIPRGLGCVEPLWRMHKCVEVKAPLLKRIRSHHGHCTFLIVITNPWEPTPLDEDGEVSMSMVVLPLARWLPNIQYSDVIRLCHCGMVLGCCYMSSQAFHMIPGMQHVYGSGTCIEMAQMIRVSIQPDHVFGHIRSHLDLDPLLL